MPTGFFDLPRELRGHIYHYVWLDTPVIEDRDRIDGVRIINVYLPANPRWEGESLPRWLLASKQILAEGSNAFGLKGRISIGVKEIDWQRILDKRREDPSYIPFQTPNILQVSQARNVVIRLRKFPMDIIVLKPIIDMAVAAGKLHSLGIFFELEKEPWQLVDLSHLAVMKSIVPSLKALHNKINNVHDDAEQELVEKALMREMKRFEEATLVGMVEKQKRGEGEVGSGPVWCWGFRFVRK